MPAAHPTPTRLALLALAVLGMHVWVLNGWWAHAPRTGTGLAHMAEPEFNQVLVPGTPPPAQAASHPTAPLPTVGQAVTARTLLPTPEVQPSAKATPATPRTAPSPPPAQTPPAPTTAPAAPPETDTDAAVTERATPRSALVPADAQAAPAAQPFAVPAPAQTEMAQTPATDTPAPTTTPGPPAPAHAENSEQKEPQTHTIQAQAATVSNGSDVAWLAAWPASTRLNYDLHGYFRGDFYGNARVQWQRQGPRYQAQVDVSVALLLSLRMTSQGRITPAALWPEAYEEERRGKTRTVRFGQEHIQLNDGRNLPRPSGLQDAASQFVQLSQDFATGRQKLAVGETVRLPLGRPGGVDEWVYDVVALDTLNTPLGPLQAYHLKPRPLAQPRGTVSVEMWFAPALQHLPARIRLTLNPETWLNLTLASVAQSTP